MQKQAICGDFAAILRPKMALRAKNGNIWQQNPKTSDIQIIF